MRILLLCFLHCLLLNNVLAQNSFDEKIKGYAKAKSSTNLFVHFDKNIYSNNETVHFTGYILKETKAPEVPHRIMAIALIREIDSTVILHDKFVMDKGLSFGSITLPDSLLTGSYRFIVYTDKLINDLPAAIFIQRITLKTNIEPSTKTAISLLPSSPEVSIHQVLLKATTSDDRFLPKPATITYRLGNSIKIEKTDASGQLLMKLPKLTDLSDPNLYIKLKYGRDSSFLNMELPQSKSKASVKFYPEGGNMVNGLSSLIAWEAKDQFKKPLAVKAFLYKNKHIIDTVETNSYGIGKFRLHVEPNAEYTLKLIHSNLADSAYYLPKAIQNGVVINISNAIVNDTLRLRLANNGSKNLILKIHNSLNTYLSIPFKMVGNLQSIKVPLQDIPKGLATLTILDTLDRPLAERIFFAHYKHENEVISLNTDKPHYNLRQKVSLDLLSKEDALVSIACVQDNRLEIKKMTDIESYVYLNSELLNLPVHAKGTSFKDLDYLEQIVLVKGWRRYTWQTPQHDTSLKIDSLEITAQVTKSKKELITPIEVGAMGDGQMRLATTSPSGKFNLNTAEFIAESQKKMHLFVNKPDKLPYTIKINDRFEIMNQKLNKLINYENSELPSTLINNTELVIKGNEMANRLKEVVITTKKDNSFNFSMGHPGSNACGDYVCSYNILNCKNHVGDYGNTQPVPGRAYQVSGMTIVYKECKSFLSRDGDETFVKYNGIHTAKEFYLNDPTNSNEPAFFSTIYWNYATLLNKSQKKELNFYTSDIKGKFRIIVQGILNQDVVYAEHFFEVK